MNMVDAFCNHYENRTMTFVEIVLRRRGMKRIMEGDESN
jgi:hypothetical protein